MIFFWKCNCFLFSKIKFQNGAHLKKKWGRGAFLTYFSHSLVRREKKQKFLQHISHLHTYMYLAQPSDLFCLPDFAKIAYLTEMVSLWCDSWCWFLFPPCWSNQWITKWWAKFRWEWLLLIFIYTIGKFIIFCKPLKDFEYALIILALFW